MLLRRSSDIEDYSPINIEQKGQIVVASVETSTTIITASECLISNNLSEKVI